MTPAHRRPSRCSRRRPAALLAVIVTAVLMLGACGTIRATAKTRNTLRRDGFPGATVGANEHNGVTTVSVRTRTAFSPLTDREAAGIVWRTFEYRVDEIEIVNTDRSERYSHTTLERALGPRPAELDRHTIGSDFLRTGKVVAIVAAGAGVLFLIVVAVVVALIVHYTGKRRRERQQQGPGGPLAPPPPFNPPVSGIGGTGWIPPPPGGGQWPPQQGG